MKSTDMVYIKLRVPEATRRGLRMLAVETGTSMSNLITAWVEEQWKHSDVFRSRMLNEGKWWHDETGVLHNPDGTVWRMGDLSNHNPMGKGGAR